MMQSQQQLFKVAELAFSQLADIPSFIPHYIYARSKQGLSVPNSLNNCNNGINYGRKSFTVYREGFLTWTSVLGWMLGSQSRTSFSLSSTKGQTTFEALSLSGTPVRCQCY